MNQLSLNVFYQVQHVQDWICIFGVKFAELVIAAKMFMTFKMTIYLDGHSLNCQVLLGPKKVHVSINLFFLYIKSINSGHIILHILLSFLTYKYKKQLYQSINTAVCGWFLNIQFNDQILKKELVENINVYFTVPLIKIRGVTDKPVKLDWVPPNASTELVSNV